VLIDHTHRKWLVASIIILAIAVAVYIPYAAYSPGGPSGGSALGLTYGILGSAFMVFAGLLAARKKVPVWRIGRAQTWMRGHLWLGLMSLPIIFLHAGFRFGGALTSVLMVLLIVVVASGIFGAILQHYLPRVMTDEVPLETIYGQIERVRGQLRAEAGKWVADVCDGAESSVSSGSADAPTVAVATVVAEEEAAPLRKFYREELLPFLENARARRNPLADQEKAHRMFAELRTLLPPAAHEAVNNLESICEEERELRRQARLHHRLHGWLLLHIPLSLLLLALGAVHAVMAVRY
jgi:hypothetical protein